MKIDIYIPTIRSEEALWPVLHTLGETIVPPGVEMLTHVVREGRSYAEAINFIYAKTDGDWFFCGADDLRFSGDWILQAMAFMGKLNPIAGLSFNGRYEVIGTNDLHNEYVLRGVHATHYFSSRRYIETYGGTFDGTPGKVLHEYAHNWTDTEFCEAAKARGKFVAAMESKVEHMHPAFGLASIDKGYEKSSKTCEIDGVIFNKRFEDFKAKRPPWSK